MFFGGIIPAAVSLYAAYWAFAIRKALVSRIYRNQALWLGAFCLVFAVTNFVHPYTNTQTISELLGTFYVVFFVAIFAWVDSTILVARRSDPLLRSILHWEKLRFVLWAWLLELGVTLVYSGFVTNFLTNPSSLIYVLGPAYFLVPLVVEAPAVLVGSRRSRDPVLRGSLRWFGIFLLVGILGAGTYDVYFSYPALPGAVFFILAAYALYKSARSLAPTSRLPAIESLLTPSTETKTTEL